MSNMVVRTNVFALNAHRNMKNVGMEQGRASNRLSSGFRINSAADDAAGLAISETMRAQIRGLDQASRNAQDGQAMLLTTEGGLEEIGNMLQRVRELLVQASNDTNTQGQRDMIRQEIGQLSQEIGSMQRRVEFNTNSVLAMGPSMASGVLDDIRFLEADNLSVTEAFDMINANRALVSEAREALLAMNGLTLVGSGHEDNLSAEMLSLLNRTFAEIQGAGDFMEDWFTLSVMNSLVVNDVIGSGFIAGVGVDGTVTRNANTIALNVMLSNLVTTFHAGGNSIAMQLSDGFDWDFVAGGVLTDVRVSDVLTMLNARDVLLDAAVTNLNTVRSNMLESTRSIYEGIHDFRDAPSSGDNVAWFQVGANSGQGIQFDFEEVSRAVSAASSIVRTAAVMVANPADGGGIGNGMAVSPIVNMIQSSLDDIGRVRANLGAVQNRMDYTMRSLDISSENLQDSESRVRNADIAREMMRFTMSNVLQQAAVSMLAQANQLPNNLLQLLR